MEFSQQEERFYAELKSSETARAFCEAVCLRAEGERWGLADADKWLAQDLLILYSVDYGGSG